MIAPPFTRRPATNCAEVVADRSPPFNPRFDAERSGILTSQAFELLEVIGFRCQHILQAYR